jgi:hypothetical protein
MVDGYEWAGTKRNNGNAEAQPNSTQLNPTQPDETSCLISVWNWYPCTSAAVCGLQFAEIGLGPGTAGPLARCGVGPGQVIGPAANVLVLS